jgi:hypothetical protein
MNASENTVSGDTPVLTNGSGAAAILSAAIGCFVLAALAVLGDHSALIRGSLVFYKPTGPLSGVTTVSILVWLVTWALLQWSWRKKILRVRRINVIALALLVLSVALTFPPVGDLF